jgi:outer membrane receptor protein involved in Fe transport
VNTGNLQNYRVKIDAQPTDQLFIGLSASSSISNFGAPSTSLDNGRIEALGAEPYSIDYETYGLNVSYDFGLFTISSNTSILDFYNQGNLDLTPYEDGGIPGKPLEYVSHNGSRTTAEELLLTSKAQSAWKWSAGAFYRNSGDKNLQYVPANPPELGTDFEDFSKSYAVFGELGHQFFIDTLEWTLGVRHFQDDVHTQGGDGITTQSQNPQGGTYVNTSPRAVLTWRANSDVMVYGSYSQGFRSGWPQQPSIYTSFPQFASVKPDKLDNYEIGTKGDLWERRVSYDLAVYYIDWRDIQQSLSVVVDGLCCKVAGVNANSASGVGTDASITFRPVQGLQIFGGVSWNNLELRSDVISEQIVLYSKGDRPTLSPEWTVTGSVGYTVPFGPGGYSGEFSVSGNYISQLPFKTLTGTPVEAVSVDNDALLTGQARFTLHAPQRWSAMLYVDNFNNWNGSQFRSFQFAEWDTRIRPRTVGIQFDYGLK